jgi:hypothetical protein
LGKTRHQSINNYMAFVKISELPLVNDSFTISVPFLTAGDLMPVVHGDTTYKVELSTLNEYFNSLSAAGIEGDVQFNAHGKLSAVPAFNYNNELSSLKVGGFHFITGENSAAIGGVHSEVIGDRSVSLGDNNSILHNNSFTIGANLTTTAPDYTYVNNISVENVADVGGDLNVGGDATIAGNEQVDGNVTVVGDISAGGGVYYNEARPHLVYVSVGGDDNNVGTNPSRPFRTIKKACQYVSEHQQLIFPYTQTIGIATYQYTIFVMTGDYTENNPIYVPQQTTLIGDSLRRTTIRPLNRTYDILWLNSACYVWGFTFRDHLFPSAATAFPNLDQTRPEFAIAFDAPGYEIYNGYNDYYRLQKPFINTSPYPQGNSSITTSEIAPQQTAYSQNISAATYVPSGRISNTSTSTVNTLYNGIIRTILAGTSGSPATFPTNVGNIPVGATTAIDLLTTNRSTIQNAVTTWGDANYPLLWTSSYQKYACFRDTGYMIDSIVADLQTGTNNRMIAAANVYYIGVLNSTGTPPSLPLPNALVYKAIWDYAYEFTVESYLTGLPAASAYVQSEFAVLTGMLDTGYESIPYSDMNTVTTDDRRAALLLSSNRFFFQNELTAYVDTNYPNFAYGQSPATPAAVLAARAKCFRDMGWFVDALVSDLLSGTNARTITYANSYYVGASSRIPNQEIITADTIDYAKYISTFIIGNSAVATTAAGCGIRVDGSLARGFLRSFVTDSFTQINEGGYGIHITNNGYAQLVSTFTICCSEGVRADNGGTCSISTSNSTFGLSGLVAVGYSPVQVMSGKLTQNVVYNTDVMVVSGLWPRYDPPDFTTYAVPVSAPYVGLVMKIHNDPDPTTYYVLGSADLIDNDDYIYRIITVNPIKAEYYTNDIVKFYIRSVVASSSHAFEYIGSGTVLRDSVPALGGRANPYNEARASGGGAVYFTSTNHLGDFKVGNDFTIIQETGTIEGRVFKRAIIALVTPLTLSLE